MNACLSLMYMLQAKFVYMYTFILLNVTITPGNQTSFTL